MTRNELYAIMELSNESTFDRKLQFMEQEILNKYSEDDTRVGDVKQKLSIIRHQFKQKWLAARKTKARFLENNAEWLEGTISLPSAGKLIDATLSLLYSEISKYLFYDLLY